MGEGIESVVDAAELQPLELKAGESMDWQRFRAALIRGLWTLLLQVLGFAAVGANLIAIGVPPSWAAVASAGATAVMYFFKKLAWPNATW